jgi:hypothetical protein
MSSFIEIADGVRMEAGERNHDLNCAANQEMWDYCPLERILPNLDHDERDSKELC